MKVLVNIRGCNGAGKSTIPLSMMDDPLMKVVGVGPKGSRPFLTLFPTYGWIALGTYFNKTGGLDCYRSNDETRLALEKALEYDMDILMEGVIASTIKSTYAELFKQVDRKVIIMSFLPPFEVCLERIYSRNGGKPIKEEQVLSKYRTVERNVEYFKQQGLTSLRINTAKVPRELMLPKFLKTVEKYRS